MKLRPAIVLIVSAFAASPADAGSNSVNMGVGLTIVADCRASSCAVKPRSASRARAGLSLPAANAPYYLTTRSVTGASAAAITMTY